MLPLHAMSSTASPSHLPNDYPNHEARPRLPVAATLSLADSRCVPPCAEPHDHGFLHGRGSGTHSHSDDSARAGPLCVQNPHHASTVSEELL